MLKDKLRHIKICIHRFKSGSTKLKVVRSTLLTESRRMSFIKKDAEIKQKKYFLEYSLSGCLIWLFVISCSEVSFSQIQVH